MERGGTHLGTCNGGNSRLHSAVILLLFIITIISTAVVLGAVHIKSKGTSGRKGKWKGITKIKNSEGGLVQKEVNVSCRNVKEQHRYLSRGSVLNHL